MSDDRLTVELQGPFVPQPATTYSHVKKPRAGSQAEPLTAATAATPIVTPRSGSHGEHTQDPGPAPRVRLEVGNGTVKLRAADQEIELKLDEARDLAAEILRLTGTSRR